MLPDSFLITSVNSQLVISQVAGNMVLLLCFQPFCSFFGGRVSLRWLLSGDGPDSAVVAGAAAALSADHRREQSWDRSRQESALLRDTGPPCLRKGRLAGKPPGKPRAAPACCDLLSEFAGPGLEETSGCVARASRHASAPLELARRNFSFFLQRVISHLRGVSPSGVVVSSVLGCLPSAQRRTGCCPCPWGGREPQKGRCLSCSRFHVA